MNKKKTEIISIAAILLLLFSLTIAIIPLANAHDPPWEIPTTAYLVVSPNPAGVDQSLFLIMWLNGPPPTAEGIGGDRWQGFTIEVTKPDGTTQTLGPFMSDPTGSTYTTYTPTQIGTYTFKFSYPGQILSLYHPETGVEGGTSRALTFGTAGDYIGDTFLPSSTTKTVTVQEEPVEKMPAYPLPTEYWERPIEGQNTAWSILGSSWLDGAHLGGYNLYQKDGIAPNSPHVMWTKTIEYGGIAGGTTGIPEAGFYSGGSYEGRLTDTLSMFGRIYYMDPLNHAGGSRNPAGGYTSVDMRTGETYWISDMISQGSTRPAIKGQLFGYESMNQHGIVGGIIWEEMGRTWLAFDAYSGQPIFNLTNVPSGYEVYTDKGEIVRYVMDYDNRWLALWNNTQDNVGLHGGIGTGSDAYQWRPIGKTVDMSTAYSWNVTIPDLPGDDDPTILGIIPGDIIVGRSSNLYRFYGTPDPYVLWAISDKPQSRGQLLWIKNYPAPENFKTVVEPRGAIVDPVNRVILLTIVETMEWIGYDLDTGNKLWGPVTAVENDFSYYGSGSGPMKLSVCAYGNLYVQGYGGEICCYDTKNGNLVWRYDNTNSGVETAWGVYPIFIAAIADGKVYAFNNEHSPNTPLYKDERVRCIDAYTGEELWTLLGWAGQTGGSGTPTTILADGFLAYYNYYDNQIYCVGKGPSATTISIKNDIVSHGDSVMITGKVTDESPGTKSSVLSARFPSGVAAISDEDMGPWMEYLYMQKPMPAAKGVEVVLEVLDSNGNFYEIGRTTSNADGNYGFKWQPEIPGEYMVIASFLGSESYWGSHDSTYIGVLEASQPIPPPEATPGPQTETYLIVGSTIAILAGLAIVVFLIIRKK